MSRAETSGNSGLRHARRRRARLADRYEESDRLPRALSERILEHLEPIRRDPARIVELGSATGHLGAELKRRYPRAQVISVDDCPTLLAQNRPGRWSRQPRRLLCATSDRLPVAAGSVDLLVCNLDLLRVPSVEAALTDWRRVLRHDAVVMIATLGPLSFNELAGAWYRVDATPHLHDFPDMHDLGDRLVRAGFSDVVMDSERLRMEFDNLRHLLDELRTLGGGNARPDRSRSLMTPRALERLEDHYEALAPPPGCWATVEAVFAHGWVVERAGVAVAPPRLVS